MVSIRQSLAYLGRRDMAFKLEDYQCTIEISDEQQDLVQDSPKFPPVS